MDTVTDHELAVYCQEDILKKKKKPRLLTLFLLFIIVDQPQCESALRLGFGGRALHTRVNPKKLYFRY